VKELLQRVAVFLYHVIDAPETAPETLEAARLLVEDVVDGINDLPSNDDESNESPQAGMNEF
jgi:hypothetical protein